MTPLYTQAFYAGDPHHATSGSCQREAGYTLAVYRKNDSQWRPTITFVFQKLYDKQACCAVDLNAICYDIRKKNKTLIPYLASIVLLIRHTILIICSDTFINALIEYYERESEREPA